MSRYVVEHKMYQFRDFVLDNGYHVSRVVPNDDGATIGGIPIVWDNQTIAIFEDQDTADAVCRDLNRERKK